MSIARTIVLALCASLAAPSAASEAAPKAAELAKARAAAAEKAFRAAAAAHQVGRVVVEVVYAWSVRWLAASIEAAPKAARQALADHQQRMADLEAEVKKMFTAGAATAFDVDAAGYYRIEAELWSARGRR
jgi:urease accessory protein UreF